MHFIKSLTALAVVLTLFTIPTLQAQDMLDRRWNNLKEYAIEKAEDRFKTDVRLVKYYNRDAYLRKNETVTNRVYSLDGERRRIKDRTSEGQILGELYLVAAKGAVLLYANISGWTYEDGSGKFWAYQISPFEDNDDIEFELWLGDATKCDPCDIRMGGFFIIDDSE